MVLFFYLVVSFNSFFKRAISWVKFLLDSTNLESRIVWESASKNSRIMATRKIMLEGSWTPRSSDRNERIGGNRSMISRQMSMMIQERTYLISSVFFNTARSSRHRIRSNRTARMICKRYSCICNIPHFISYRIRSRRMAMVTLII